MDPSTPLLPDRDLTDQIIQAAIRVHKALGPGFLEIMYEEALCIELTACEIPFERQKIIRMSYLGKPIGEHRLDLLVAGRVVVELKAIQQLEPIHFSIVRSYMKAANVLSGLILNFASMPLTIKRVGREKVFLIS
jgi:GxxExxY protein